MATTATAPSAGRSSLGWSDAIIDADVHATVPSLAALEPYLSEHWREYARERGWAGPGGVEMVTYPGAAGATVRPEWRPGDGRAAASDLTMLQRDVLDPWDVEYAIVTCSYPVDAIRHPDLGAALAAAVNDWLAAEWLDRDPRLRATLRVPARDPQAMIAEIERVGGHPGFVQVHMPVRSNTLYGQRMWHPVHRVIAAHDLVLGLHWGGVSDNVPSTVGPPSWYIEEYAAEWQNYAGQIDSLVIEGVFNEVPDLRVAVFESGFAWLPSWLWRIDKDWKGTRRDTPWLSEPPSHYIRQHMRFSAAPADAGPTPQMARIIEWLGDENVLMFATDYPHNHDDDLAELLKAMPEGKRRPLMAGTARDWYRL